MSSRRGSNFTPEEKKIIKDIFNFNEEIDIRHENILEHTSRFRLDSIETG